jgi:hypothetical protein
MQAKVIRTPLWYISNGIFTYFIAFMMYAYSLWNTAIPAMPVIYSVLFAISSAYFVLGFFAAKKKYS